MGHITIVPTTNCAFIKYHGGCHILKWCETHQEAIWVQYPEILPGALFKCGRDTFFSEDIDKHSIVDPFWETDWDFEFLD